MHFYNHMHINYYDVLLRLQVTSVLLLYALYWQKVLILFKNHLHLGREIHTKKPDF